MQDIRSIVNENKKLLKKYSQANLIKFLDHTENLIICENFLVNVYKMNLDKNGDEFSGCKY